jgi:large subunit ribosomal protein L21
MYAIIETGGKQIKVSPDDVIYVEKVEGEPGSEFIFDKVLMINDDQLRVGTPYLEKAQVKGELIKQGKSTKIIVFKYKAKHNERKTQGHRQPFTAIKIVSISH